MSSKQLKQQIEFLLEIDKLKSVFRQSYIINAERTENDAEHSWHLAMMSIILAQHANETVNIVHVLKMVLIHDIVEIDAGDILCYAIVDNQKKVEKERKAAERIYSLLPGEQKDELIALWEEFEKGQSADAKFARALDRLMPLLHNYHTKGKAWQEHGVVSSQVLERNKHIAEGSKALWDYAEKIILDSVEKGYLKE